MVTERAAMLRAIDLAWRGWGQVHPNPMVGAVVLADGVIIGEGYHAVFGERHAERIALEMAGPEARGSTLIVTLEPCNHHGKQPPCVDAVIEAGVRRVVMALPDPNPEAGGGALRLAQAGVEVDTGLQAPDASRQNAGFLHRFGQVERPWIALKLATSIDHRIADRTGKAEWVSGPEAREYVHDLRAGFDAIALGTPTQEAKEVHGVTEFLDRLGASDVKGKYVSAFGSYGWSGEGPYIVGLRLERECGMKMVQEPMRAKQGLKGTEFDVCRAFGMKLVFGE